MQLVTLYFLTFTLHARDARGEGMGFQPTQLQLGTLSTQDPRRIYLGIFPTECFSVFKALSEATMAGGGGGFFIFYPLLFPTLISNRSSTALCHFV